MNTKLYIAVFFVLFTNFQVLSHNNNLLFKHIGLEQGLSQSTVYTIFQDNDGFMWFGTDAGLNKFDGYDFTVYTNNPLDTSTISSNLILDIQGDSYGGIWIGTGYDGLNYLNKENETFTRFFHNKNNENSISGDAIRAIYEDSKKQTWIGTAGDGLNLFNRSKNTFIRFKKESSKNSLATNYISSITEDNYGNLWLGSVEGYIIKFNPDNGIFENFKIFNKSTKDLFHTNFGYIYIDSEGFIWFCTDSGLAYFNPKNNTYKIFTKGKPGVSLNSNFIVSIHEYSKNIFLISTDHGGLNMFNKATGKFTYFKHNKFVNTTLKNNQLYNIYQSPDSIIWIGSFIGGVNYYDHKAIKFDQLKYILQGDARTNCCNSVIGLEIDQNNDLWVAYDGQGVDIYRPGTGIIKTLSATGSENKSLSTNIITCLYNDSEDYMWLGTYLNGLSKYNPKNNSFKHFKYDPDNPNSINGNNVWSIIERDKQTLWVGTLSTGLGAFHKNGHLIKKYESVANDSTSLTNNDIFKLFIDSQKTLWVGTRNGLNKYIKETDGFKQYKKDAKNEHSLFGSWVYSIFEDNLGNLWIGTDAGLNKYIPERDNFEHFLIKYNDENCAVLNILNDEHNNLWISTNNGITKYNILNNTYRNYDVLDGLQGVEFNYTSAVKFSDGSMYFGGRNGFNTFHPDSIKDNTNTPNVFITDFKVFNNSISPLLNPNWISKHINYADTITLPYSQNVISIKFAAINYTNTPKNQYAYKLEGFDHDWNYTGNKREASFTNLNPGKYTFHVKASNNDGYWNNKGKKLLIIITPPFWLTFWFIGLCIFVSISIVGLFYYLKIQKLKRDKHELKLRVAERTFKIEQQKKELLKHQNHLEKLVNERTTELKNAKEKAEESDRLKSAFLANMSHEIRTPMNSIVGFSELLADPGFTEQERSDFIKFINNNCNALLTLIEDILDVSLIEANQIVIKKTTFELNTIINNIYSSFALTNSNANVDIILANKLANEKFNIYTDQGRLTQIITNLLNNAIKFTNKGSITLGVENHNNDLLIFVKDTGIGIPPEKIKTVFGRFSKSGIEPTNARGVGLGLSISKQLTELLGGCLELESELNVGSTFMFKIKIDKLHQ